MQEKTTMKTFKTPKGTELPILNLRGKDYLQVAHRIVWFREEMPKASIETSFLKLEENITIARAVIRDENGNLLATATKKEDKQGFADHMEKAESGSIGRALAMCGFGTQFTFELEENERVVDSPLPTKQSDGEYRIPFGKYQGKTLAEVDGAELFDYCKYLGPKNTEKPSPQVTELLEQARKFFK
jgi:hypothetical protein